MSTKFNEGQYGLKPWLANLIMGLLEFILVLIWFLGSLLVGFGAIFSFDIELFEAWDATTSITLAAIFLVWNLLVWLIKPLRTKFNYRETWWNLIFIIWLVVDAIGVFSF